ncbi:outer membrane beta-barrel protein [Bradyrhizobium ontarionense]|uniref:Outer membrane beta-barrel protein n=1 Tax=Bradyrhizobium ontarionense TaxID=2898149 RepID=A0ABY3R8H2_9BRAD|nr:outer membrane beta-barrel protein [Bradyrhizobium sp. A19]UFZ03347.1 outer membrane beta-barrel protein [Bradyrhizobium sp. A19]
MVAPRRRIGHDVSRRQKEPAAITALLLTLFGAAPSYGQDAERVPQVRAYADPNDSGPVIVVPNRRRQAVRPANGNGPVVIPQVIVSPGGGEPEAKTPTQVEERPPPRPRSPIDPGAGALPQAARREPAPRLAPVRNGFFGAPSAGLVVGGCLSTPGRLSTTNVPDRCLDALAFAVSPPPATRGVLPRNLPPIPRQDAQPIPPVLADKPRMRQPMQETAKAQPQQPAPPMMEEDPYEPKGIKVGNFILKPAFEMTSGFDSNPGRVPRGAGSGFVSVAPVLLVRSQFDQHLLNADVRVSYIDYAKLRQLSRPTVDAKVNGRYDITDTFALNGEGHVAVDADDPGTPRFAGRFARIPLASTVGGSAGVTKRFEDFEVSTKAAIDRVAFQNAPLVNGQIVSNADRNFNQYASQSRVTYNLTPEIRPFVDVTVDRRVHDIAVDAEGFRRDSTGTAVEAGVTFAYADKLTGDVAVGYLTRRYQDPMLKPVSGFIADANLTWQFAKETAIALGAKSQVVEITEPGISGVLKRDVTVGVEHQFQPWLVGTFLAGYGQDAFTGTTRVDDRYVVELGMLYKFSRLLQLRTSVRREETRSNVKENNLSATVVQVGARVQY